MKSDKLKRVIELLGVISAVLVVMTNLALAEDIPVNNEFPMHSNSGSIIYINSVRLDVPEWGFPESGSFWSNYWGSGSYELMQQQARLNRGSFEFKSHFYGTDSSNTRRLQIYNHWYETYIKANADFNAIFTVNPFIYNHIVVYDGGNIAKNYFVENWKTNLEEEFSVPFKSGHTYRIRFIVENVNSSIPVEYPTINRNQSITNCKISYMPPIINYSVYDDSYEFYNIGISADDVEQFAPVVVPKSIDGVTNIFNYISNEFRNWALSLDPLGYVKNALDNNFITYGLYYNNKTVGSVGLSFKTNLNMSGSDIYFWNKEENTMSSLEYYVDIYPKYNNSLELYFDYNNLVYYEYGLMENGVFTPYDPGVYQYTIDPKYQPIQLINQDNVATCLRLHFSVSRVVFDPNYGGLTRVNLDNIRVQGIDFEENPIPTKNPPTEPTPSPIVITIPPTLAPSESPTPSAEHNLLIDILKTLLSIPHKIIDLLGDLLKYLFVPEDFTNNLNNSINNLEQSIGILGFPIVVTRDIFAIALNGGSNGVASLHLPSIDFMGAHFMDSKDLTVNVAGMCGSYFDLISGILLFGSMMYFIVMTFRHFGLGGEDI